MAPAKAISALIMKTYSKTKTMKKTITTIVLSITLCAAFAQKTFKPIHFTSYCDYTPSRLLDNIWERRGPLQQVTGVIEISPKDSVVSITPTGGSAERYKITSINDEVFYQSTNTKAVVIYYTNEDGKTRSFAISRKGSTMEFVKYNGGKTILYNCDYLTEL